VIMAKIPRLFISPGVVTFFPANSETQVSPVVPSPREFVSKGLLVPIGGCVDLEESEWEEDVLLIRGVMSEVNVSNNGVLHFSCYMCHKQYFKSQ